MRLHMLLWILALFVGVLSASPPEEKASPSATKNSEGLSPEQNYIHTRESYFKKFKNSQNPESDGEGQALAALEKQLKQIIGPNHIEGFSSQGKINLETFAPDDGNSIDGIRFEGKQEALVVTTDKILQSDLARLSDLPKNMQALSKDGDFYRRVFDFDAEVTNYTELPVQDSSGFSYAQAILGLAAQDIGPFPADSIYVFASKGSRVLLVRAIPKPEIKQIAECKRLWDDSAEKARENPGNSEQIENQGFEAYRLCFAKEVKNQKGFNDLMSQVNSIVARLKKN